MRPHKRKAPDEHDEAFESVEHSYHGSALNVADTPSVRESRYANLYTKEIDFRSLAGLDPKFAAM
jgi:hypothetical protein